MPTSTMYTRTVVLLALTAQLGWTQSPVILDMRIENRVVYTADTADITKLATDPRGALPAPLRTFANFVSIADIVSINGRPVKGTWTIRGMQMNMSPTAAPSGLPTNEWTLGSFISSNYLAVSSFA